MNAADAEKLSDMSDVALYLVANQLSALGYFKRIELTQEGSTFAYQLG